MEASRKARRLRTALALVLSLLMVAAFAATGESPAGASARSTRSAASPATTDQATNQLPIVFVHGYLGSGAQYQDQAQRFDSNGYPSSRIRAFDYNFDSSGLDAFIDNVRREFGVQQVNVAAHSLGTAVMLGYLLNPAQSAKVAKYVALDGIPALCLWGTQCTSIYASSLGQTHIESSLSPESFAQQYRFFTGQAPRQTTITRQTGTIQIAGRALYFQVNQPASGTQGELWQINPQTGMRVGSSPLRTFTVGSDGNFGPFDVQSGVPYEIQLSRSDTGILHYYYQPWIHSTYLLRLQVVQANSAILQNTRVGNDHAAGVVLRYREWWRSHGAQNDDLTFSQQSQAGNVAAINILQRQTADIAGVHVHDDAATPRQTTLNPLNYFSSQAFQTGIDVYMPASGNGPNGTITFSNNPRGDAGKRQVVNIPNWPSMVGSTRQGFLVEFNSYVQ
jgi:pimeloyl-ACP methyl ester carboxylesterase